MCVCVCKLSCLRFYPKSHNTIHPTVALITQHNNKTSALLCRHRSVLETLLSKLGEETDFHVQSTFWESNQNTLEECLHTRSNYWAHLKKERKRGKKQLYWRDIHQDLFVMGVDPDVLTVHYLTDSLIRQQAGRQACTGSHTKSAHYVWTVCTP